jgi:hypothetical protein
VGLAWCWAAFLGHAARGDLGVVGDLALLQGEADVVNRTAYVIEDAACRE